MTTTTLLVTGMACDGCASKVKQVLETIEGVIQANVTLDTGHVEVSYTESTNANPAQFKDAIETLGFDVEDV